MNPTLVSTAQSVVDQVKDIDSAWAHSVEGVQTAVMGVCLKHLLTVVSDAQVGVVTSGAKEPGGVDVESFDENSKIADLVSVLTQSSNTTLRKAGKNLARI